MILVNCRALDGGMMDALPPHQLMGWMRKINKSPFAFLTGRNRNSRPGYPLVTLEALKNCPLPLEATCC